MRDNGLQAASWVLLADLDPRVADAALEALRRAGVAAYTNPHPGIRRPYLDVLPNPAPTDQLYVDAAARQRAREVLVGLQQSTGGPDMGDPGSEGGPVNPGGRHDPDPAEVDAEFARIIAGLDVGNPGRDGVATTPWPPAPADPPTASGWEIVGSARHDAPEDPPPSASLEEEHFVPPPPPPVPRGDALSRFAWLGLLGAPVVAFVCIMFGWTLQGWQALLLAGAFVGGFAILVIRMGNRDVDDDPQGGAVV
jgi:hypothetical protein